MTNNTNSGYGEGHPIEGLMKTAMESIKGMIDVNTVVGQPVQTPDGGTIIPVSRVSFGFAAGGGEYWKRESDTPGHPFGGGSGAGVTVHPVGFLVAHGDNVRLLSVDRGDVLESLVNNVPQLIDQIQHLLGKSSDSSPSKDHTTLVDPHTMA
ncbi:MAG: sporulation protein YtfJ [Sulfobacillus thermosulfidooxidans]|uniref:Sporulation protein YtfJ n=1 Tax=Sulfobacillus thermotolerans TaxID=338644 RepID=A0ABM6RVC5_9FIRM|nr:GerW family sporulation protein [Sulfobacillus sp. hq2]AUW95447.1 sporulation protein YtfJ [Sulfobacillus thermotolerans]MCY0907015.1 GerW family sporulation protein [Sulfobacillus thermotolerans]POB11014.1 sporulation protein YtfJ [Sulfobacillus sp. hq2]PSR36461.1 MAG: sporulation protein YtfJ [Sulfobacillus thermosulfidooxidans]